MGGWLEKNARGLLAVVGGLMVLAGISWWVFFYEARYTITPAPSSASVTVDDIAVTTGTRVKLKPGPHVIAATLNDFIPFSQTIQAKSGQYATLPITLRAVPHLQVATKDRVTGVALEPTTNAIDYINQTKQEAERVSLTADGKPTAPVALSPAGSLQNVDEWLWAPTFDLGLFRRGDRWTLYNFNRADLLNQTRSDWPDGVGSVSWHPSIRDEQTANSKQQTAGQSTTLVHFNAPSGGEQTLVETDPLHSVADRLTDLRGSGVNSPTIAWVGAGDDVVLLSKDGRLWRFIIYTRSLSAITQSETVDGFVAAPNGQIILAHTSSGQLFTIGIDGKNKHDLKETGSIAGAAWAPDSSAIWLATTDGGLKVQRIVVATDIAINYATPQSESVGALNQTLVTSDEKTLVLAGDRGIATLSLVSTEYPEITVK